MNIAVWITMTCLAGIQETKDPDDAIEKLASDLQGALKKAPTDADARGKMTTAAKAVFDRDIANAAPKVSKAIWDWQTHFLEMLIVADKKFATAGQKTERAIYITACKSTFGRQILSYKESSLEDSKQPTVDDVFGEFFDAIGKAKGSYTSESSADLRSAAYNGAKDIFGKMIQKARGIAKDPQRWYDEQLVRIDKEFSITTEKGKKWNTEPNAALKTAAKTAFDRALKAEK